MSTQARQLVVNSSKMRFTSSDQRTDLLDPSRTNTYLIAMLQWTLDNLWLPILVLSVSTGRSSGFHSVGCAIDCYPANWQSNEKQTCVDMMTAFSRNPFCEGVGLGGVTKNWRSLVSWPPEYAGYMPFDDNASDHLHAACANSRDVPGARAAAMGYTKYTG